jgi:hypothetical protein
MEVEGFGARFQGFTGINKLFSDGKLHEPCPYGGGPVAPWFMVDHGQGRGDLAGAWPQGRSGAPQLAVTEGETERMMHQSSPWVNGGGGVVDYGRQ